MAVGAVQHIACIMDGNRRWARTHSVSQLYSQHSADAVFAAITSCKKNNVRYLSLYAFSLENSQQRDEELKKQLFSGLIDVCLHKQHLFIEHGVRVQCIGVRTLYSPAVLSAVESLEAATATQTALHLSLFFYYGGQQEIVAASIALARDVAAGVICLADINQSLFSSYLSTALLPPPDLIIRTGGAHRLSNFLSYQSAYSELLFLDCLWPEITEETIDNCIKEFSARQRNFGK